MFKRKLVVPAILAAATATLTSTVATAAVVCNIAPFGTALPFNIPQTIDGVYANLATGAFATVSPFPAGWDFNPYASSTNTLLSFFTSTAAGNTTRLVGSGTIPSVLPAGTVIDGTSVLTTAGANTGASAFRAGGTNLYAGVVFNDEVAGGTRFGWVALTTTGPNGFPATVTQFCFENTGAAITAGTTPVTVQSFQVD